MAEPIKFPDEPIRVDAGERATPRELTPEEREDEAIWDESDNLEACTHCAGDGFEECNGSGADDGEDTCVRAMPHVHSCGACRGSGLAKDQWIYTVKDGYVLAQRKYDVTETFRRAVEQYLAWRDQRTDGSLSK